MQNYTDQDFRDFGEDQGFKWDDGFSLDCLVSFEHEGRTVVNPYSHTQGDPADIFGAEVMAKWQAECAELFAEWEADQ